MSCRTSPERIARDKDFIVNHQTDWPCYPVLPMKRVHGNINDADYCALMLANDTPEPVLYIANLMAQLTAHGRTWSDVLAEFPLRKYASLDALLTDYTVD